MEPREGGFWHTDDKAAPQPALNVQPAPTPASVSAFNGYDLTQPEPVQNQPSEPPDTEISWEASEYIQHDKDAGWFIILIIAALALFGLTIVLKQWTFAAVVVAMTTALVVYAKRPPRLLHYHLSDRGLLVEDHPYAYSDFRSFGVIQEGPLYSIRLIPRQRFMPPVSVYFDQQDGEQIVDILGTHLPMQTIKADFVDALIRKLRF